MQFEGARTSRVNTTLTKVSNISSAKSLTQVYSKWIQPFAGIFQQIADFIGNTPIFWSIPRHKINNLPRLTKSPLRLLFIESYAFPNRLKYIFMTITIIATQNLPPLGAPSQPLHPAFSQLIIHWLHQKLAPTTSSPRESQTHWISCLHSLEVILWILCPLHSIITEEFDKTEILPRNCIRLPSKNEVNKFYTYTMVYE